MKFQALVLFCLCASQSLAGKIIKTNPEGNMRIVGGAHAEEGQAPFQCSIQVKGFHHCGCAIVNNKWIITAAHCIWNKKPSHLEILVGTNDLMYGGTRYKVSDLYPHSRFNEPKYANDIGLIRINGEITFSTLVQPIEFLKEEVQPNSGVQLTGWGSLSTSGGTPHALQIIKLLSLTHEQCKNVYVAHNIDVSIGHICTFTKVGEGVCFGDSGSPLTMKGKLVGIVNWVVPCAKGYPDAYASVSYYFDWIQNTIKSNSL